MASPNLAKLEHYGLLNVAGDDARAFLHAQLTNDVENLAPGQARYAGWCSAKGRLLATFLVVPWSGGFLLQLSRDLVPAVLKRLSMFVLRSKVKITDVTGQWAQYGFWESGGGMPLIVSESDGTVSIGVDAGRRLVLAPDGRHVPNTSADDWALAEIRAGRALITQATQDQFVPQMVNLELSGGVDFKKGCYPGQEIVARAQYRGAVKRRMVRVKGAALTPGQELFSEGQSIGMAVNAAGDESLIVLQVSVIEEKSLAAPLEILPLPYAT